MFVELFLLLRELPECGRPTVLIVKLFFFWHVHTRVREGGIQTCDLRFIRRGSQPIELPLGDC
jgi:hypothetical protein